MLKCQKTSRRVPDVVYDLLTVELFILRPSLHELLYIIKYTTVKH